MDIRNLDREKYELLVDLVTVSERYVRPYPLWSLPADSLRLHPYIGDYSAKGIVLYRENNPKERWTVEELVKAGILSPENAPKLARCLIQQP